MVTTSCSLTVRLNVVRWIVRSPMFKRDTFKMSEASDQLNSSGSTERWERAIRDAAL